MTINGPGGIGQPIINVLIQYGILGGEREEFSAFVGSWEADAFDAMRFLRNIMPGRLRCKFSQHATLIHEMN
ncbi:hypothetical protein BHYA_0088g00240 [Botrytis hyacinthi]|uniref:Uncharacterized protein n=1 Tax=Botrytis hyacinthi TaxID=278943 RepID=A0A4Z1GWV0_9HELO|nr:hypothetical protein BHYA_0088g00240 [Botrytis hyacinthi]